MRRARAALLPLVAVVLAVGCSGAEPVRGVVDESVDARPRPEAVAAEDSEGAGPFGDPPRAEGGAGLRADSLLAVRHGEHGGFERVVLDLGSGKAPAGAVPRWTLDSPRDDRLLRITLPSANATDVSGGRFGDGLLQSFHVVRAPEGGMFVDILTREAFRYRVLELEDPARLVVDFEKAKSPAQRPRPAFGGNTVLVEPRRGAGISDPLTVSGYSRNPEAANTVVLTDAAGKTLARETVAANDWTSTWGYFEATLDLPPFRGKGTLRVGAQSARDGTFSGVEIPVDGS